MIDLNDRFTGLMIMLLSLLAFELYLIFFTKLEETSKKR